MPYVYNRRLDDVPKDAISITRPTKFGNPFVIGKDGTREEVISKYRRWLVSDKNRTLFKIIKKELRGKILVCVCSPLPCHGDVLLNLCNKPLHHTKTSKTHL